MVTKQQKAIDFIEKFSWLFFWLRWFYPKAKGIKYAYLGYYFFPQKILRINGAVPWPMHFTSRIISPKKVKIGNHTAPGMSAGCYIQAKNGIELGSNVRIGPNVGLISADHDQSDYDVWVEEKPIKIGDNVWIGMNSVILSGVEIGDNVVIGAGSIVTKDIPENSIAVGNPCRVIKNKEPYAGEAVV